MSYSAMSSADEGGGKLQLQAVTNRGSTITFRKWVSFTFDSDQFYIDSGSVRCEYLTTKFMSTVDGDVVIIVPAAFRYASQMVAHAVLPSNRHFVESGKVRIVEIPFCRSMIRCDRQYQFAYVDGHHYDVMGVSEAFTFVHCNNGGRRCDCSCDGDDTRGGIATVEDGNFSAASAAENSTTSSSTTNIICEDIDGKQQLMMTLVTGDDLTVSVVTMSSLIASLMDIRSSASQCTECRNPSNHQQVLDYLTKHINRLKIDRERLKQTECLDDCTTLLEYLYIKNKMLTREMESRQRFANGLISSLLTNRRAIFQTGSNMIFIKMDETMTANVL